MVSVKSVLTINFVTSTERQDNLIHVHALQDANFMTSLELAVRFGKTLIIREMDRVEPALYPLLRRDLIAQGSYLSFVTGSVLAALAESDPHWERVRLTTGYLDQAPASLVQRLDVPYQGTSQPILLAHQENAPGDPVIGLFQVHKTMTI